MAILLNIILRAIKMLNSKYGQDDERHSHNKR